MKKKVKKILSALDCEIALPWVNEVSIVLTSDREIHALNLAHRKKNKPTDVLSFPQYLPREIAGSVRTTADTGGVSLGDVVISEDTLIKQAKEFVVTANDELNRLLVHGILHLCGYDHEKVPAAAAQRMRRRERQIRKVLR